MSKYFKILFVLTLMIFEANALSEVRCSQSISYVIEKESQSSEVYFGDVKAFASDENLAKQKIESDAVKIKTRAMQQCRKLHENASGCLKTKLESSSEVLQSASFSVRKALEDTLIADCKKQQANCKEVKQSEVKCEQLAAPAEAAAEGKDKDAKAKEGEKDKKAKK